MALRKKRSGHVAEGGRIVRRDSAKARYAQQLQLILTFVDQVDPSSTSGTPASAPVIEFPVDGHAERSVDGTTTETGLSGKDAV